MNVEAIRKIAEKKIREKVKLTDKSYLESLNQRYVKVIEDRGKPGKVELKKAWVARFIDNGNLLRRLTERETELTKLRQLQRDAGFDQFRGERDAYYLGDGQQVLRVPPSVWKRVVREMELEAARTKERTKRLDFTGNPHNIESLAKLGG